MSSSPPGGLREAVTFHPRQYLAQDFVYPVISRRARGLSVGINLNVDKLCNYDCVYCQVDRRGPVRPVSVDPDAVEGELRALLREVSTGAFWSHPRFAGVPQAWRGLHDIALSGDGEPTTYLHFAEVCRRIVGVKTELGLADAKVVVITNTSGLHRTDVQTGLDLLAPHGLEIWAKLEAGTEAYYQRVERTKVPFERTLRNITDAARRWPVVIQSLFMRLDGVGPDAEETAAYVARLCEIRDAGGDFDRVQVYTVARPPAEDFVSALIATEIDTIADAVAAAGFTVERFYEPGD